MRKTVWKKLSLVGLGLISSFSFAQQMAAHETLKMQRCLAEQLPFEHKVLAEDKDFQIVSVPIDAMDALAHLADTANCGRFINLSPRVKHQTINPAFAKSLLKPKMALAKPALSEIYSIKHQSDVHQALEKIEPQNIQDTLTHLVSYYNRSASKKSGVDTAQWLKEQYDGMAKQYGRTDTNSYFVETGWYIQPSLVTVMGKDLPGPGIVIGAHMDTLNGRMPGAGDDGSGSSSVMEVARVLMASEFRPARPVYIIWYAAEEQGLVGSQYVVDAFAQKHIPVKAAIQFDMTGFRNDQSDPTMWLFRDYTDAGLTAFSEELIKTYVKVPVKYSHCGYGCSDHASWDEVGVPAAFPCETSFEDHNPYIHSSSDTMDLLNLEHMTNFSKLGVAFVIELASD